MYIYRIIYIHLRGSRFSAVRVKVPAALLTHGCNVVACAVRAQNVPAVVGVISWLVLLQLLAFAVNYHSRSTPFGVHCVVFTAYIYRAPFPFKVEPSSFSC